MDMHMRRLLLNDCTASYSSVPLVEVLLSCHIYPPTLSVKRLACRLRSTHPALRCMGCVSSVLVAGACGAVRLTLCGTGARADHRAAVQVPAILQDRVQRHQPKPGTGAAAVPLQACPWLMVHQMPDKRAQNMDLNVVRLGS